jgi:hypothetical protein
MSGCVPQFPHTPQYQAHRYSFILLSWVAHKDVVLIAAGPLRQVNYSNAVSFGKGIKIYVRQISIFLSKSVCILYSWLSSNMHSVLTTKFAKKFKCFCIKKKGVYQIRHVLVTVRLSGCISATRTGRISVKCFAWVKVKVNFTLERATKSQNGSRGVALLFL